MKNNVNYFFRAAVATPKIEVANTVSNVNEIACLIEEAEHNQVKLLVLPELCVTGYTCQDLFLQQTLIDNAYLAVNKIIEKTRLKDCLVVIGFPFEKDGKLYNVAGFIKGGEILAIVPKTHIPNYNEFYEARYFIKGNNEVEFIEWCNSCGFPFDMKYKVPFGTNILLKNSETKAIISAEICEDLWAPNPPSIGHAVAGANIIVNPSASNEVVGKGEYRRSLVTGQSAKLITAYLYASAGDGESTQDLVFSSHNMIAENGNLLGESKYETGNLLIRDIDLEKLNFERRRINTYEIKSKGYMVIDFKYKDCITDGLQRIINKSPFIPSNDNERKSRCQEILLLQALGLRKRMEHIGCKKTVIGVSGGLDSTLALLVIKKTYEMMNLDKKNILAITMPCFGTTNRTYDNSCKLANELECTLTEISIKESVIQHLKDIGHDISNQDITYENAQARERTQVLMDLANQENALVVGTGDLSELALGWCTYNGDHMSMYAVNADIPKTLVRHMVKYYADFESSNELKKVLYDILDTPVSPELLPPDKTGKILQKTEDKIGPYELHDFYLYYTLRFGYKPDKILYMAEAAFGEEYKREELIKWLTVFYKRFFSQQFKRSCLPDGPKVGSVAISPRGDLRMPSDASSRIWLEELEKININQ